MAIDCHWHPMGTESPSELAKAIEGAGLEKAILFAPYYNDGVNYIGLPSPEANRWMAKIARAIPERVIGFGWIEPTLPGAVDEVERCVSDYGLRGIKMIPNHWYPTDEAVFPVYEKIQEMGVPIIFHAGILYGYEDGSRFCQPIYYEALIHFPGIKFALAHIAWPWVDECLAVFGRFEDQYHTYYGHRPAVRELQMYIDLTPGTPPAWRVDALRKTLAFVPHDHILWGSDTVPQHAGNAARHLANDRNILTHQLGIPAPTQEAILGGNIAGFLARA